jgi:hypothetical protein
MQSAHALVRAYLRGRTMPKDPYDAVVWFIASRAAKGKPLALDEALRIDIDYHLAHRKARAGEAGQGQRCDPA